MTVVVVLAVDLPSKGRQTISEEKLDDSDRPGGLDRTSPRCGADAGSGPTDHLPGPR
jgi:hypothetical protein